MGNYNAITGISEQNLNRLSDQIYSILYQSSKIFKDTRVFDKLLLYSVSYDVTSAPVFILEPSVLANESLLDGVKNIVDNSDSLAEIKTFIDEGTVTFSVSIPSVNVAVVLRKGEAPVIDMKGSLTAGCTIEIDNVGKVIPKIVTAKIAFSETNPIEKILNTVALPVIIEVINNFVSKGFLLPLIKLAGASFSHPSVRIENNTLVAYAALSAMGPTVLPAQQAWPRDKTFAYFDKYVAEGAARTALENTQKSGTDKLELPIIPMISYLTLTASYTCGVKDPVFDFREGIESGITFTAYGGGKLSIQVTNLPSVSASFSISSTPTASSTLTLANGQLLYTLQHINEFKVYIDVDISVLPLPKFIKDMINDAISFVVSPIAQLIGEILHGLTIKISDIKPVDFEVAGTKVIIMLADNVITTYVGPDGKQLVSIEGMLGAAPI